MAFIAKNVEVTNNYNSTVVIGNVKLYVTDALAEKLYNMAIKDCIVVGEYNPNKEQKAGTGYNNRRTKKGAFKDTEVFYNVSIEGKRKKTYAVTLNAAKSVDAVKKDNALMFRKDVLRVIAKAVKESGGTYHKESGENIFTSADSFNKFCNLLHIEDVDGEYSGTIEAHRIKAIWDNNDWSDEK